MEPMTSAGPMTQPKPKGTVGIVIGAVLVIAGIVGGIALVAGGAVNLTKNVADYQRVSAASGGTMTFDSTGKHYLFYEASAVEVANDPRGYVVAPAVVIVGPDQQAVQLEYSGSRTTYDLNGRHGRSMGHFDVTAPGTYTFRIVQAEGGNVHSGELAVGTTNPNGSIGSILGGVFGGGLLVVVGIVVIIVSAVRRGKSRRPPGGYGGYGAYPPGPGALPGWGAQPGPATGPPGWAPPAPAPWSPPPTGSPAGPPGWAPAPAPAPSSAPGWAAPPPLPPLPPLPEQPPLQPWAPAPDASAPTWPPRPPDAPSPGGETSS